MLQRSRLLQSVALVPCNCFNAVRASRRFQSTATEASSGAQSEASAAASQPSYPFSNSVTFPVASTSSIQAAANGTASTSISGVAKKEPLSIMDRVNRSLLQPRARELRGLFARRGKARIPIGSIISIETYNSPSKGLGPAAATNASSFAGVLMGVKRRHQGVDDAFRVRANIGKPGIGTEVRFDLNSPWIKDIKVLKRNQRDIRAKLYYIRRDPKYVAGVSAAIKSTREPVVKASSGPAPPASKKSKKGKKSKVKK